MDALRHKYCPPLEEALFYALANDFDLNQTESQQQLEQLLEGLKEQAVIEQELELATPLPDDSIHVNEQGNRSRTSPSSYQRTGSEDVGDSIASATTGLSELRVLDAAESHKLGSASLWPEDSSSTDKRNWLKALFPTIESVQIEETIARANGDPEKCVDELLNLSFITSDPVHVSPEPMHVPKGVDGFAAEQDNVSKRRKGKFRKKPRNLSVVDDLYLSDGTLSSGATTPSRNVWHSAAADVEFITSRTQMAAHSVKSIYHGNGANLAQTLKVLTAKEAELNANQIRSNEILQIQAAELKREFSDILDLYVYGALVLAQMLPSAAKDLLEAMTAQLEDLARPTKIVAQYTPVELSDEEPAKKKTAAPFVQSSADPSVLIGRAGDHRNHANHAFQQASSSFRRGKSNPAYGGVAAYYASVGHERRKKEKELLTLAADAWVSQQSTSGIIDLHGVNVEHAVRIARSSVANWWEGLGDRKYALGGIGEGFRIITGVGTHSTQGIARIGPAVSKALMRDGWKINVQRGEIFVEGKTKRI